MADLLFVENDRDLLNLYAEALRAAGHTVRTAESGVDALAALRRSLPEVLITDLIMQRLGGEQLARIVRANTAWRSIPIIVVSAVAVEAPEIHPTIPCDVYIAKGRFETTLEHVLVSIDRVTSAGAARSETVLGINGIHSRQVTRELLDFRRETDAVLANLNDGVCIFDRNRTIIRVNPALCATFAVDENDILGRPLEQLFPSDTVAAIVAAPPTRPLETYVVATGRDVKVVHLAPDEIVETEAIVVTDVTDQRASEREQAALHYEAHRRVRDILQVLTSMMRVAGTEFIEQHIVAIGEIVDVLYASPTFSRVEVADLMPVIVASVARSIDPHIAPDVETDLEMPVLPMWYSIPLTMMIAELVAISVRTRRDGPAFPVNITARSMPGSVSIAYKALIPPQLQGCTATTESAVLSLLAEQVNGEVFVCIAETGVAAVLTFPVEVEVDGILL